MSVDGLFVAGLCNYPKPIDESISQAKAAASRAGVILSKEVMELDAIKSFVTERCDGCALCLDVCPYRAIQLEEIEIASGMSKRIKTDPALCKGCGLCAATCPKGGVHVHGFTLEQLQAQVNVALADAASA
jgi:heterodisulfide reductase subunit A